MQNYRFFFNIPNSEEPKVYLDIEGLGNLFTTPVKELKDTIELSKKEEKNAPIQIYLNKEEIVNLFTTPVIEPTCMKTYEQIREEAFNEPLKIVCEDKIAYFSKQLTDADPIKFSAELSSMTTYIFLANAQPSVAKQVRDLCKNTLDWLGKEIDKQKKETPQAYYEILACLTLYTAVFDVEQCPLIERICTIRKKISQENYELALAKFAITPPALVSAFHRQQKEALTKQLTAAQIIVNKFNLFKSQEAKSAGIAVKELPQKLNRNKALEKIKLDLLTGTKSNDDQSTAEESSTDISTSISTSFFARQKSDLQIPYNDPRNLNQTNARENNLY